MSFIPRELGYSTTNEWVRMEANNIAVVGITDYAQRNLGEIIYIELPDVEGVVYAGDDICEVEAAHSEAEIYSPLSGTIIAINEDLAEAPTLVNTDPYGDGWLFKIKVKDILEYDELLNAKDYKEHLAAEGEDEGS